MVIHNAYTGSNSNSLGTSLAGVPQTQSTSSTDDMDRTLCIEFYSMIEPVRAVQIKAQAMQTFVIVDVYVMLYSLYTIILDVSKPLELIIPVCCQLGSKDPDPVSRSHDVLQPATRETRKFLGKAMSEATSNGTIRYWRFVSPRRSMAITLGDPCY
jgi:hypothetical protein